jgi:magnesium chelatase subunit I
MNPEEGRLRPQILDRFGLRVNVRGLMDSSERALVYQRVHAYRLNPTRFIREWESETAATADDVALARELLKQTEISQPALETGLELIHKLRIDSHRAEYTMFEAARAYAAADGRNEVTVEDVKMVAPMALRMRQSEFMTTFFDNQQQEDTLISRTLEQITPVTRGEDAD